MTMREPVVAGMFYPGEASECTREIEIYLSAVLLPEEPFELVAGIVPHAGWVYSAATAAHVMAALADEDPETVVLFGAVHRWGIPGAAAYASGAWRTPLGALEVDAELAQAVLAATGFVRDVPAAHAEEHAIEVQLPFIKHLLPPRASCPSPCHPLPRRPRLGVRWRARCSSLAGASVALGSTDLTHYGPRYGLAPAGVGSPRWIGPTRTTGACWRW